MGIEKAAQLKIGKHSINRIGLGTNRISDNQESSNILKQAVELGINFIDTAELYGLSQEIIGETLAPYPSDLLIATKGGYSTNNNESLQDSIDNSLELLKLERLPLWQLHRVNPDCSLEDTMRFLKSQMERGKIENLGLSEVSVEQIKAARKIVPIVSIQNH